MIFGNLEGVLSWLLSIVLASHLSGPGLTQLFLKLRNGAIFPALVEQLTLAEQRKHGLKPMDPSDQRLELTQLFFMRLANQFKPYIGF